MFGMKNSTNEKTTNFTAAEIEEYRALRNEIITYINAKQNLVHLSLMVILALLSLQITTNLCFFSLCSTVAICVFFSQDSKYKNGIAECGAYIRAKFENESGEFHWETSLSSLNMKYDLQDKIESKIKQMKYKTYFRSIFDSGIINHFSSFAVISALAGWISFFYEPCDSTSCMFVLNLIVMIVATLITVGFIFYNISLYKSDFNQVRESFYKEIKDDLFRK